MKLKVFGTLKDADMTDYQ